MENSIPRSITLRTVVHLYLGFDPRCGIHHFHPTQTQEVEITAMYIQEDSTFELIHGTNLYTGGDMSSDWLLGLEKHPEFISKLAKKLHDTRLGTSDTIPQMPSTD